MNEKRRDKQIEFLDAMDSKESLGRSSEYWIMINYKIVDVCKCSGTAIMLLNTKYKNIDVFIKKIA